jgi:phosphoglycerate dehydrogenase-like enzyme
MRRVPRPLRVVIPADVPQGADYVRPALPDAELRVVDPADREAWRDALADADAVLTSRLTPDETAHAASLRLIQTLGAGADGIDPAAVPAGCALASTHGHAGLIAEYALLGMLAAAKRLIVRDRALRRGSWAAGPGIDRDLAGRRVGLVGYGNIGRGVAERARGFGMTAAAVTRTPDPERAAGLAWIGGYDELPLLLEESDFAVVSTALAPETRGLIGAAELRLLGPAGYLVNVARGPVVDEQALYEALRDGAIAGAAIDVWYRYPERASDSSPLGESAPSQFPFHELDNVVMTPHVAGVSEGSEPARWREIAEQLRRLAHGESLRNVERVGPPA